MNELPSHAVVILAAGASRRLGTPKQLLSINGELLINRIIRVALTTRPAQTLLVLGHGADEIHAMVHDDNVARIDCSDWQSGMSASLRAGIDGVDSRCDGALILLCDQPELASEHLQSIVQTWRQHPDHAVASRYQSTLGVPALLPRSWFPKIGAIGGDQGARELLRSLPQVIGIPSPQLARDIDFPWDLPAHDPDNIA